MLLRVERRSGRPAATRLHARCLRALYAVLRHVLQNAQVQAVCVTGVVVRQ